MSKTSKNKWHRFAALENTDSICTQIQIQIIDKQYYQSGLNPQFNQHVNLAAEHLAKAYQLIDKSKEVKK